MISDVSARAGRFHKSTNYEVSTENFIQVNLGSTILDNVWVWRADYDYYGEVKDGQNSVTTGIIINGDDVVAYNLSSDHSLGNMLEWNGDNGQSFSYKSEYAQDGTEG